MAKTRIQADRHPGLIARMMLLGIRAYQRVLSPLLGGHCRFEPSCSHYAHEAIVTHGPIRGGCLGVRRLCRCRPGGGSGFDPVPDSKTPPKIDPPGDPT